MDGGKWREKKGRIWRDGDPLVWIAKREGEDLEGLRVCLDGWKWRERKGRDLEGDRIPCLDSKLRGKGFGGRELKGFD